MGFCTNCGRELPPGAGFCPKCGTKVNIPVCPKCGKEVTVDDDFCLYCGAPLAPEAAAIPEPEPVPEPEQVFTPVPEPAPAPKKPVEVPAVCPHCGKPTVAGYEHCVYCGAYWDTELSASGKPKQDVVRTKAPQSKTAPSVPPKSATTPDGSWHDVAWTYRRAMARWNMYMAIHAEVDDKQLRCTSTSKILGQTDIAEEKMELKDISEVTLASKASFMIWTAVSLMLSAFATLLLSPLLDVYLAVSGMELVLTALFLTVLCALTVWWVRFNLFHHRLIITGTADGAEKKIILDALKSDPLKELQGELIRRTDGRLSRESKNDGEAKAFWGMAVGVCLGIALVVAICNQEGWRQAQAPDLMGNWESIEVVQDSGETFQKNGIYMKFTVDNKLYLYSDRGQDYLLDVGRWALNGNRLVITAPGARVAVVCKVDRSGNRLSFYNEDEKVTVYYYKYLA